MKNQMIIGDDPKYRQICVQGICSLEIRKPGNFDGGVYTCRAKNNHGEAIVSCKLEVKRESILLHFSIIFTRKGFHLLTNNNTTFCSTEPTIAEADKK